MARPSVGLQSLWELAASAKRNRLRESSEPPEDTDHAKRNTSTGGMFQNRQNMYDDSHYIRRNSLYKNGSKTSAVSSRRSSDIGTAKPTKQRGSSMENELSRMQRTYVLQNQALAKNNSVLLSRILEMEARMSSIADENMSLRALRNSKDLEVKKEVEAILNFVELKVLSKVGEICQMLATVRSRDSLPENPMLSQVQLIVSSSAPATSTPIEGASRPDMLQEFANLDFSVPRPADFKGSLAIPEAQLTTRPEVNASSCDEANDTVIEGSSTESPGLLSKPSTSKLCDLVDSVPQPPDQLDHEIGAYAETDSSDKEMVPKSTKARKEPLTKAKAPRKTKDGQPIQKRQQTIQDTNQSPPRKRSRKPVSYAMPSLRLKMRRESAKFIDAVGGEIKLEPLLSPLSKPAKSKPNRQALSDVTASTNNKNRIRKASAAFNLEGDKQQKRQLRSVFDFTDSNEILSMHRD